MRTLLDRKTISSITNGQVAARRVTGLIMKRLWLHVDTFAMLVLPSSDHSCVAVEASTDCTAI